MSSRKTSKNAEQSSSGSSSSPRSSSSESSRRQRPPRFLSGHFNVLDYDRIIHGLPPLVKKSRPVEKYHRGMMPILPRITLEDPAIVRQRQRDLVQKLSIESIDIPTLVEVRVEKLKNNAFLYLMHALPPSDVHFDPYNLVIAPYSKINRDAYYTISKRGVTFWSKTENHFTSLDEWYEEYKKYCSLTKIKIFKKFRQWKTFYVWLKSIKWRKFKSARNHISENLFFANPILHRSLLEIRDEFCELSSLKFTNIQILEKWHLFYFVENQMAQFEIARDKLQSYHQRMHDKLFDACIRAIEDKGYSPIDEVINCKSIKKVKEEISFTMRSAKKTFCTRLTKFLCLADLITINLLHVVLRNSFVDLARIFQLHTDCGPSIERLLEMNDTGAKVESSRPDDAPQSPLFTAELVLKPNSVDVDPSRDVTTHIMNQMIELFFTAVHAVEPFQGDDKFKLFTEPSIVGHQEEKLFDNVLSIDFMISIDEELQRNRQSIIDNINLAYEKVELYIQRFDPIREAYKEDVSMDKDALKQEKDLDKLITYCERYTNEMNGLENLLPVCYLGVLQLNQGTFKEEIIPTCRELLSILETLLPNLARETVLEVREKAENLMTKLTTPPIDAQSFVNFLNFLDVLVPEKIVDIEKVIFYALKAFQIMKEFEINISDEEKENFLDSEEFLKQLKTEFKSKLEGRQDIIDQLAATLMGETNKIKDEVENVSVEIQKPELIDENSVSSEVRETLAELNEKLHECQEASIKIKKWQKDFRIDISRFDTLDIVFNEVRLRQTLWDSILQWKDSVEEWNELPFHKLNMQQIVELNTKILKNCGTLEKNLPKNSIVPKLKLECEEFKEKLPVLLCLRSPDLKPRHWLKIEQILDRKLLGIDNITIYTFEEANAFDENVSESIQEVSGQASGEARLEDSLKKIDNIWKAQELTIVNHRDSRDVYILAGIDELQAVLDDSNVTVTTIAASRHIGTLKPRVEEWIRQLELFAKTFESWQVCQQSWIYLEAIFSAPDIQRQLPHEAKMFVVVDKSWKEIMRHCVKFPLAMPAMTQNGYYEIFKKNNGLLDQITRCLEAYLEVKRVAFPRFYFLSNDELLEILAQTKNPHAVQPHLRKCFDAIAKIEFGTKEGEKKGEKVQTNDILAMLSPEGEKVQFNRGLKARGAVEDWLGKVEDAMFTALKRSMKYGLQTYKAMQRTKWIGEHPNQVVLTVSQQQWAEDVHSILDSKRDSAAIAKNLERFEAKLTKNLAELATMARGELRPLTRRVLCALITIDVHAKDTISSLIENRVVSSDDFNWQKMLRYYWKPETETMTTRMASANLPYFYEYLGAGGVLVITPLTDRCYLCLMGALQMDLGGAPAGPAGTGKTETTKDLAKALAVQCVVFNCSDGLDYKMMGRFFSGLAQSGAWCCFDEFNRIDIEVLSVIAQQLITIRNAKALKAKRFVFEGREIKLVQSCATFITMNPGYAGRTELPDNLKALFRPVSMMIPDYKLIATVILYSEGFEESQLLAQKMIHMYKLCSEQLSQQDHYDFGMRAVKSVLVMAGALKRASPSQREDITLICALRDSNLPKFLSDDAILFNGILNDLFPGVELPANEYGDLQRAIEASMRARNLQTVPALVTKVVQLYETMKVRWGVMLVGPAASGKSSTLHVLGDALTLLSKSPEVSDPNYRNVKIQTLNPKSVSADELYGAVNLSTLEWKDGLLGLAVRSAVSVVEEEHQWIVADGPVDAVWIENLNTLLDDNKMLCLANSERIKLTPWVHMIFEVQDLAQASPATVSRCGMVYIDQLDLSWEPLVESWLNTLDNDRFDDDLKKYIKNIFTLHFGDVLKFARSRCAFMIHQVENSKVEMLCTMLKALITSVQNANLMDTSDMKSYICKMWIWSTLWSIGSNFMEASRILLERHFRRVIEGLEYAELPEGNLFEYRVDPEKRVWEKWEKIIPAFAYSPSMSFYDMLVPTSDTVRFGYVADILFRAGQHVMLTGETGVGKSVIARQILTRLADENFVPVFINFSAQTSSARTQEMIESRLEKRKRTLFGAPLGKKIIFFIDDVNMPKPERYGAQPPIELLRQFLDFSGFFDRDKLFWKGIADVVLGAACGPPGGGRNSLPQRFVRHFSLLSLPSPNTGTLVGIFGGIIVGFFSDFSKAIWSMAEPIVLASISMYERIAMELLPTPQKSHYVFNLRDLSKCIQGVLQANTSSYTNQLQILRLFYHESMRVFHDRLVCDEDKAYFKQLLKEISVKYFDGPVVSDDETILYGDFMIFGQARENRVYEEIRNVEKLKNILNDYLLDYNALTGRDMNLILFHDCIEHILRITRLLRAERGNGLLVGLSGTGKQSIAKLASHINGYHCMQIELTRGYEQSSFREDLRKCYTNAGVNNNPIVFLLNDTQILREEFLEDINNILNSGEVPNLFEGDEYEKVILNTRNACVESNYRNQTRDGIYEFFISRVRTNLHVVLCMSPIGDNFRRRCRMFPSLVNCCTIDWFVKWPPEALYAVALGSLRPITKTEEENENMAKVCVMIHQSVEDAADRFYREMRRHYYTTPSSYLELLKQYHTLLKKRIDEIVMKRDRIANGLSKILETNEVVTVMSDELRVIVPIIEKKSNEMKETVNRLEKDTAQADAIKTIVAQDETEAKQKAMETQELADDAARDLEVVMPQLRTAQEALKALNKADINEIKVFQKPPKLVQFVMESVCILLNSKPDWNNAKTLMNDVNFLKRLQEYDANNISESTVKKLRPYVENKEFQPAVVEKVSKTARSMCAWVIAMNRYAEVYKDIEPKIRKRDAAENELRQVMAVLKYKQNQLAEIEAKIQALKDDLDVKQKEMQAIQDRYDVNSLRLTRAGRLTAALSDEEVRWRETVAQLSDELVAVPGDVLVASACIAYLGAFSIDYRRQMSTDWIGECQRLEIPCSSRFDFIHCLGDAYQMRTWNLHGLPRDPSSLENGIIVTQSNRWPLMIDPQEQANQWIRSMEKENNLVVMKMNDVNLIRTLEMSIRQGVPVLLEEIDEVIEPSLTPVLAKAIRIQGGRMMLRFGDADIDYDPNFRLYMTTKLTNPHYLPEVCIQVTVVNFLVSRSGLEDQLLADVVRIELPEMERQRNELIVSINSDKQQLILLEDKILKLLFASKGNILDDEELVETLNESKDTAIVVASRLQDAEKTEEAITFEREKYRNLASKGTVLFFVVTSLAEIDPMYQFSLRYFSQVFCSVIEGEQNLKLSFDDRLEYLITKEIFSIFTNVGRGLFERHKVIFGFLLAIALEKYDGRLGEAEIDFLLKGGGAVGRGGGEGETTTRKKPAQLTHISESQWSNFLYLEQTFENFRDVTSHLDERMEVQIGQFHAKIEGSRDSTRDWNHILKPFEKLMLISCMKFELLVTAMSSFVGEMLGRHFVESQVIPLSTVYQDTSPITPLIFVLSTGSDPMSLLQRFAQEREFAARLNSISLGQGQGAAAENLIANGRVNGHWIFLQNCHLATSWMESLQSIVRSISLGDVKVHEDFRLFLSSMPSSSFPVSVLQNSVKLTNEPPKGLKANLIRSLNDIDEDMYEVHILGEEWKKMVFGICMFHGIILERRKFGSLGFNIHYEFNESDRDCALRTFDLFIDPEARKETPWQALEYINGEITYGGRVTDALDQRCLRTILKTFSSERILQPHYAYSDSGIYRFPAGTLKDAREYVNGLPYVESPEIFGMHDNANTVYQTKETNFFISTLLDTQSKSSSTIDSGNNDDIVLSMIDAIKKTVAKYISIEEINQQLMELDEKSRPAPLTTVLFQEIEKFNKLLRVLHTSLNDLEKAIKGFIVMSEPLEEVYSSFLINQVPDVWSKAGFLSTKTLGSWTKDFILRIEQIESWIQHGAPSSFWISGFFFPQGFLTGVLQTFARSHNLPIDFLKFDFAVQDKVPNQMRIYEMRTAADGCESHEMFEGLVQPEFGVNIHGLFIEAGRWNVDLGGLCDAQIGELSNPLPALWLKPSLKVEIGGRYEMPLYKTSVRAGTLSTTGHSTNFVVTVLLESQKPQDFWILRGTALVPLLTD